MGVGRGAVARETQLCETCQLFLFLFYIISNVLVRLLIGMQLQEVARAGLAGLIEKEGLEFSETTTVLGRKRWDSYH